MKRAALVVAVAVATLAQGARAEKLDPAACDGLRGEQARLIAAGARRDMERGPEWARANLGPERLTQIGKLMSVDEKLIFRCSALQPQPVAHDEAAPAPKAKGKAAKAVDGDVGAAKPKKKKAAGAEAKGAAAASDAAEAAKPAKKKSKPAAEATAATGDGGAEKPRKIARKAKADDAQAPAAAGK